MYTSCLRGSPVQNIELVCYFLISYNEQRLDYVYLFKT